MQYSKFHSRFFSHLIAFTKKALFVFYLTGCVLQAKPVEDYYHIMPLTESKEDVEWAGYLSTHLQRRSTQDGKGTTTNATADSPHSHLDVKVHLDHEMRDGCRIQYNNGETTLLARDEGHMLWLIYQFIALCGEADSRLDVSDLPPSTFDLGKDRSVTMAFDYRSIYAESNRDTDFFGILGASNIDFDWAIWGHNFGRMLEDAESAEIYALVDGVRLKDQYCFSSKATWNAVTDWIDNHYGSLMRNVPMERFVIMPSDNDYVCLCPSCRDLGNTSKSATGAVTALVNRLAAKYPAFQFFTSSYLTTKELPTRPMEPNTGVLISAIDLPFKYQGLSSPYSIRFFEQLKQWKKLTPNVYIWDYSRNFDDYLTPFPILSVLQERFQKYRSYGVNGVILNDGGESYVTFGDLQTFLMASLLIDPDTDLEKMITRFLQKNYPASASLIAPYYLNLERSVCERKQLLDIYGGVDEAVSEYLSPEESYEFFHRLDSLSKHIKGDERKSLNKLLTGLSFMMTELDRAGYLSLSDEERATYLDNLTGHTAFPEMTHYREDGFTLDQYIGFMKKNPMKVRLKENLLAGKEVKCEQFDATARKRFTDGMLGIPMDWHVGWNVTPVADELTLRLPPLAETDMTFRVGFLKMLRWRLGIPSRIELWQGENRCGQASFRPENLADMGRHELSVKARGAKVGVPIEMRIFTDSRKLAIDEIVAQKSK